MKKLLPRISALCVSFMFASFALYFFVRMDELPFGLLGALYALGGTVFGMLSAIFIQVATHKP